MQSIRCVVVRANQTAMLISVGSEQPMGPMTPSREAAARKDSPHPACALLGWVAAVLAAVNVLLSQQSGMGASGEGWWIMMAPAKVGSCQQR